MFSRVYCSTIYNSQDMETIIRYLLYKKYMWCYGKIGLISISGHEACVNQF